jgi:hypothetical protein
MRLEGLHGWRLQTQWTRRRKGVGGGGCGRVFWELIGTVEIAPQMLGRQGDRSLPNFATKSNINMHFFDFMSTIVALAPMEMHSRRSYYLSVEVQKRSDILLSFFTYGYYGDREDDYGKAKPEGQAVEEREAASRE